MLSVTNYEAVMEACRGPKNQPDEAIKASNALLWHAEHSAHPNAAAVRACPLEAAAVALWNAVVWRAIDAANAAIEVVEQAEQMPLFAEADHA